MADTLSLLSIISFAVSGVCLALAVVLWIVFRIPSVIGDLSGRTAKKSIAKLRLANEKTGVKSYRESKVNAQRGKVTETMSGLRRSQKATDTLVSNQRPETGLLRESLGKGKVSETTGLLMEDDVTEPLEVSMAEGVQQMSGVKVILLEEILLIHTDERIAL